MIRHNGIEIDRATMAITIKGKRTQFLARQRVGFKAISHLLLTGPRGATREEVYESAHGDCPNGGTEGGPHDVSVWLSQAFKPQFARLGVELCKHKALGRMRYYLRVV